MINLRSDSYTRPRRDVSKKEVDLLTTPSRKPRAHRQTVKSTSHSAACRGLYATATHRTTEKERGPTRSAQIGLSDRALVRNGEDDNDPIIKHSMYPQMNGKRRSELEAQARIRSTKYRRASSKDEDTAQVGHSERRRQLLSRVWSRPVVSDFAFDSGYSSDSNLEGRPVRGCISHQAKRDKEPVNAPLKPQPGPAVRISSKDLSAWRSPAYKRSNLPGEEYQMLVRRQKMQRAREVLEPHYTHRGSVRGGCIWHGMMQCITVPYQERYHMSEMQYAVRKALRAGIDLFDADFKLAMHRHADGVHFCEFSDVDGAPVEIKVLSEFMRLYQEARDAAIATDSPGQERCKPIQRTWNQERDCPDRQAAQASERVDSVVEFEAPVRRPQLVSKFSWDSSDGEVGMRKRLMRTKR